MNAPRESASVRRSWSQSLVQLPCGERQGRENHGLGVMMDLEHP